ncbi:MAG TPA: hypothetical protein VFT63_07190 [bacterium]|nr:hypothetical protein [bacterium]
MSVVVHVMTPMVATAEEHLSLKSVVRVAPELNVVDRGFSARTVGYNVVKFEEGPSCATATVRGHESTLPAITLPHSSLDLSRDVT